jgi:N-acetylneuraminate synthase
MKKPIVIAEIGCNHKGEINIAKDMIKIAALYCKVDAIKFQKRNNRELLSEEEFNAPHPNPKNSYGRTYGEHREFLEFTIEQHKELKELCEEYGVVYSTSVWDMTSAREVCGLNPRFIKVPSAMNTHYEMLEYLFDHYSGEIHISTGMTNQSEIEKLVNLSIEKGRNKDIILYNCTSGYPVPYEDICLLEINILNEKFKNKVKAIGFSGHHLGTSVDIAAFTLGAEYIERHFTLDKTWKGTDHSASLEPDDMRKLVVDLENVSKALNYKTKEILDIEEVQREKLKYKVK